MNFKGNLLEFSFKEDGVDQTFAINLLNLSHYYVYEDKDGILTLDIYINSRNEPVTFYGGNADVIEKAISQAIGNERYELVSELDAVSN